MIELFKQRNFTLLLISRLISRIGDWILDVALPVWVYQLTGSATLLGAMVVVETIPSILLAPLAGVFVDRWDRRRLLVVSNLLLGASILLLFLVRTPEQIVLIFFVGFFNACVGTFLLPAQKALVPQLVDERNLLQANSLMTLVLQAMRFVGPALGAAVLAFAGPQLAFSLDAGSFVLAALCVAGIHTTTLKQEATTSIGPASSKLQTLYKELVEGLSVIRSSIVLRVTLLVWSVLMLAAGVVVSVLVVFVRDVLGGSQASYGFLLSMQGLGMVLGGAVTMALGKRVQPISAFTWGLFLFGVIFLAGANAPNVTWAAVLVLGMGAMMSVVAIADTTIFQEAAPEQYRGRVLATNEAVSSLMVLLGAAFGGLMVDAIGVRIVFNLSASLSIAAALLSFVMLRSTSVTPNTHCGTAQPAKN